MSNFAKAMAAALFAVASLPLVVACWRYAQVGPIENDNTASVTVLLWMLLGAGLAVYAMVNE